MTALSICIGLITFLGFLYLELTKPSAAIPRSRLDRCDFFVAFLLIGDLIRSYLFLEQRSNATDVLNTFSMGNISSIFWTAIAASYLGYILLTGRFRVKWFFCAPYFSIFVLILVYLVSSTWSVIPSFSLYRAIELIIWICLSVYFFTGLSSVHRVMVLAIYCFTWLLLNIPLLVTNVSHNIVFSAIKDNYFSIVGFTVVVLGWTTRLRSLFCIIGLTTFVLAGSASSVASALAAFSVGFMFKQSTISRLAGCIGLIASISFIIVFLVAPDQFPETVNFLSDILQKPKEELLDATGRYTIWALLWDASKDNYFGTGFGSDRFIQLVGNADELTGRLGTADIFIMSAHNAALSAWVAAGWLGVVALFFAFINGIRYSIKCDVNHRAAATMILVFIVINSLTIPGLGANYTCIWLVWIAVLSVVGRGLHNANPRRANVNRALVLSGAAHKVSLLASTRRTKTPVRYRHMAGSARNS